MAVWVSFGRHEYKWQDQAIILSYTQAGELKFISMIYAPPYLIRRTVPKVKSTARSHRLDGNPESTQDGKHWKASNGCTLLLWSITRSRRQYIARQRDTNLSSRTVTNSLSGVSITHDEYRTFKVVQVVQLQMIKQRLLTWQLKQSWHVTQAWQKVKHKVNYLYQSS